MLTFGVTVLPDPPHRRFVELFELEDVVPSPAFFERLAAEMRVTTALASVTRPDQIDSSVLFPAGANRAA